MVQIANAWAVHRKTGEEQEIAARDALSRSNDYDWRCPDACCRIPLTHYKQHIKTFHDPVSGQSFKTKVAAHFRRKAHGPAHAAECKAVDDYTKYQLYARSQGGLSHQGGSFVFNVNIPTDNALAAFRRRASDLSRHFRQRALERLAAPGQISYDEGPKKKPLSAGLSSVEKLAELLNVSAFDPSYRESIILRDGPRLLSLAQIYKDDPLALYREQHERAKKGGKELAVLVHFKPIAFAKYHSKRDLTIQGQAVQIAGSNCRDRYSVSVMLHCGSRDIFESLTRRIKNGDRSFLLYAPSARVDLIELAQKKYDIANGLSKDNAVYVHVHANRAEQITAWSPPEAQMSFAFADPKASQERKP